MRTTAAVPWCREFREILVLLHMCGKLYLYLLCMGVNSVTFGKEHRLRLFENKVLRRIFGPKRPTREEVAEAGEDCLIRISMTCTLQRILLG
jgi:hypothetical protein